MGNAFTAANGIWVQTEKPNYFEGDVVNGTIYLNCVTPFNCKGLKLCMHGEERTKWVETRTIEVERDGQTHTETERIPHHGHNEFFRVDVNVYNWQGQVMPGQYAFPFTFVIPAGLPGAFDVYSNSEETHARIFYRINSECDVKGFFNFDIKHAQELTVQQRLRQPILATKTEAHENITKCCCISKGSADLKAHLDKNAYTPGETAQIICEVSNQSEVNFPEVKVELVRVLVLRSNRNHRHHNREVVCIQKYPGLRAGEVRTGQNAMHLPLTLGNGQPMSPTVHANLIDCEYYVELIFVSDSIMVSNLDIKINVTIYPPQPAQDVFVQQYPPGFNPQIMGQPTQINIPMPSQAMLPPRASAPAMPQQQYPTQYSETQPLISNQPAQQQYAPQYN